MSCYGYMRTILLLMLSSFAWSCTDFETNISSITYQKEEISISDVLQEDYGAHTEQYYNMDFWMIGSQSNFEENQSSDGQIFYTLSETVDYYLFVELFSPGAHHFRKGTFMPLGDRKIRDLSDEYVFRTFYFGENFDERIQAKKGSLVISDEPDGQIRISFDVTLENGEHLKGFFNGQPIYFDRR